MKGTGGVQTSIGGGKCPPPLLVTSLEAESTVRKHPNISLNVSKDFERQLDRVRRYGFNV